MISDLNMFADDTAIVAVAYERQVAHDRPGT